MSNVTLECKILAKNFRLSDCSFFKAMTIFHIFVRRLGKLSFDLLHGWLLN